MMNENAELRSVAMKAAGERNVVAIGNGILTISTLNPKAAPPEQAEAAVEALGELKALNRFLIENGAQTRGVSTSRVPPFDSVKLTIDTNKAGQADLTSLFEEFSARKTLMDAARTAAGESASVTIDSVSGENYLRIAVPKPKENPLGLQAGQAALSNLGDLSRQLTDGGAEVQHWMATSLRVDLNASGGAKEVAGMLSVPPNRGPITPNVQDYVSKKKFLENQAARAATDHDLPGR